MAPRRSDAEQPVHVTGKVQSPVAGVRLSSALQLWGWAAFRTYAGTGD